MHELIVSHNSLRGLIGGSRVLQTDAGYWQCVRDMLSLAAEEQHSVWMCLPTLAPELIERRFAALTGVAFADLVEAVLTNQNCTVSILSCEAFSSPDQIAGSLRDLARRLTRPDQFKIAGASLSPSEDEGVFHSVLSCDRGDVFWRCVITTPVHILRPEVGNCFVGMTHAATWGKNLRNNVSTLMAACTQSSNKVAL